MIRPCNTCAFEFATCPAPFYSLLPGLRDPAADAILECKTYQHWRAEIGGKYYRMMVSGEVEEFLEDGKYSTYMKWCGGNYFQTPEKVKELEIYKAFHKEEQ